MTSLPQLVNNLKKLTLQRWVGLRVETCTDLTRQYVSRLLWGGVINLLREIRDHRLTQDGDNYVGSVLIATRQGDERDQEILEIFTEGDDLADGILEEMNCRYIRGFAMDPDDTCHSGGAIHAAQFLAQVGGKITIENNNERDGYSVCNRVVFSSAIN